MDALNQIGRAILAIALTTLVLDVLLTLLISLRQDKPGYFPSISEAGCFSAYRVYSSLGVLSSLLLLVGFELYALSPSSHSAPFVARGLVAIMAVIMSVAFAYQSVVKINLQEDNCPHRMAAGIFFISSYIVMYASTFLDVKEQRKSRLRWLLALVVIFIMWWEEKIYGQWSASASVAPLTLRENNDYISKFSIMEYCLAATLVMLMGSLLL